MKNDHWKLEPDSYWVRGLTGYWVSREVHDLVRGCEEMLRLPWPHLPRRA